MWAEPYNPLYVWGSCFHQIRTPFIQGDGSVQQGLSAAYESIAFCKYRRAADKRYSLANQCEPVWRVPRRQRAGDFCHHIVHKRVPAVCLGQLLRNCPDMTQSPEDIGQQLDQLVFCGVHWREIQRGLSGMLDRPAYPCEQERSARNRLHPDTRLGGPAVPAPPVVDQRHGSGAGLAALNVLGP